MSETSNDLSPGGEQILYARILRIAGLVGLGILLLNFALYVLGIISPAVPIDKLPEYWCQGAQKYLAVLNTSGAHPCHLTGRWWLRTLDKGEHLNSLAIAWLASVTIVCYIGVMPRFFRKGDLVYAAIALAEVAILVLAACGLFCVGR